MELKHIRVSEVIEKLKDGYTRWTKDEFEPGKSIQSHYGLTFSQCKTLFTIPHIKGVKTKISTIRIIDDISNPNSSAETIQQTTEVSTVLLAADILERRGISVRDDLDMVSTRPPEGDRFITGLGQEAQPETIGRPMTEAERMEARAALDRLLSTGVMNETQAASVGISPAEVAAEVQVRIATVERRRRGAGRRSALLPNVEIVLETTTQPTQDVTVNPAMEVPIDEPQPGANLVTTDDIIEEQPQPAVVQAPEQTDEEAQRRAEEDILNIFR